jgi:UDP-N-acetylmuramoyl-tripeptide--D-alanyl-D-alanine ligase
VVVEYPETTKTAEVIHEGKKFDSVLTGNYNAVNIAAAICIGTYFRVPEDAISKAIASYIPTNNRSQMVKLGNNTLLMDAYNANPTSMRAALSSFENYPAENKWVILGDMFELGETSEQEHQDITSFVEEMDLERAFLVGNNFYKTKITHNKVISKMKDFQELKEALNSNPPENCYILVKGSRGMALERVQDIIREISKV